MSVSKNLCNLSLKELDQRIKIAYDALECAETDEEIERLENLLDELETEGEKKIEEREKQIEERDKKIEEMMKRIEVLENAIFYSPNGEGYQEAKNDFEKLNKK